MKVASIRTSTSLFYNNRRMLAKIAHFEDIPNIRRGHHHAKQLKNGRFPLSERMKYYNENVMQEDLEVECWGSR